MPSPNTSLPLELLDMIIQHLSSDAYALRSCAQVSRTWSGFGQRALFRNAQVNLSTYKKMAKLLDDLISIPHLQTLIRGLTIYQRRSHDGTLLRTHMSCLATVLSLLPNLTKVVFKDDDEEGRATRSYLDLIPNVPGNTPLVELDIEVYSIETFRHLFEILGGTNIKRVSLSGSIDRLDSGAIRKRLRLPSLERIHFGIGGPQEEFHNCLMQYFDLPNLKQCEIVINYVADLVHWQDILLRGFPPLELFKWELDSEITDDFGLIVTPLEEVAFRPIPLAGLPFQHVHLCVNPENLDDSCTIIEWWSSTFRALSDSKATIHFTELTFTLTDLKDIDTLEEAWNSLDDSLAHRTFSGVRNIHFERSRRQGRFITRAAYSPVFADRMRLVLPRLASRGVLRFV
ncbi:hypothetical protein BDZ89DRAFT_1066778 [Hymenopellis radicata]|nr:hypothetical protein BDZ89DRAFT_1066778 [Hymenopellis radicata]